MNRDIRILLIYSEYLFYFEREVGEHGNTPPLPKKKMPERNTVGHKTGTGKFEIKKHSYTDHIVLNSLCRATLKIIMELLITSIL